MRLLVISLLIFICGCTSIKKGKKPLIVCSTSIIADCTRNIVGEGYEVVSLMGAEIDPHSYNPRPSDAQYLDQADVIIYNGFHLEGKMAEIFHHLKTRKKVVCVADYFPKNQSIKVDNQGSIDPHIWFDTPNWITAFEAVSNQLAVAYPESKTTFEKNYVIYRDQIMRKYEKLRIQLAGIPVKQRVIITSHDAFHYFARAYNCEVKAIQGTSTTQEPSIQAMRDLEKFIMTRQIKALFVESSVNPKSIESVIENCKTKGHTVIIGGTLYSDALGAKKATTYLSMIESNCHTIYNALKP